MCVMKIRHCLVAVIAIYAVLGAGQISAVASECLSEDRQVNLKGFLSLETFPGRPNYMSIEKGDEPETGYYLNLSNPVCVQGLNYETGKSFPIDGIKKLQLVIVAPRLRTEIKKLYVEKAKIVVTGEPSIGITGHYHAPHGAAISVEGVGYR
jgi:hypothetical protein